MISYPPGSPHRIPNDARLFIEVFVGDNKVKTTGWLMNETAGRSWRLDEYLEVSYSVPSTRLTVMVEYAIHDVQRLGSTDLMSDDLLGQYLNQECVRLLGVDKNDDWVLRLAYCCSIFPHEALTANSAETFEDADDRRAFIQRLALASWYQHTMGDHDTERMFCDFKFDKALQISDENLYF